jgi:predicted secreted protein
MKKLFVVTAIALSAVLTQSAFAQQIKGTVVSVSGAGEITADNDQAKATFFIEEQDKDMSAAASRVNKKMHDGTELLKKLDPDGKLATRGYYSYPIYADQTSSSKLRTVTGWRVGQYLDLTTKSIEKLPATAASVQQILLLNGLNFGLSDEATKKLEASRIEAAYKNLQEKIQIIAKAMGKNAADATIESLDFDGAVNHFQPQPRMFAASAMMAKGNAVQETSFEPGQTTLSGSVVAKLKFD